jgi:hypothetical protein
MRLEMGRTPKKIEPQAIENALTVFESQDALSVVALSDGQKQVMAKSANQMTIISSRIALVEREIDGLTKKVKENPDAKALKERKADLKMLRLVRRDATNRYNGALEIALAEFKGNTLAEKLENLALTE